MIPEGWQQIQLEALASRIGDGIHATPEYDEGGEFFFINGNNIRAGAIVLAETTKKVGSSEYLKHRLDLDEDTILMSINGTIGNLAYYRGEPVILGKSAAYIKLKQGVSKDFIYHVLASQRTQRFFQSELTGTTIRNLSLRTIRSTPILIPNPLEQGRISEILKTWDLAIETVEALITNARAQKQALMQQLLPQGTTPPKKRLPGFSREWKRAALGEIGAISSAGVDKKIVEGETAVRLLNFLDAYKREFIYDADLDHVVTAPKAKVQGCSVSKGDVFFTPSSETRDDIALAAVAAEDMPGVVYSYHVVRFRPTKKLDLNFSAYVFQTDDFKRQAYRLGDGSGQRYVISQSNFRKMQVSLPDIEEQAAIGSLLAEHSKSIAEYETQLSALRQEKAALMQQLLTGKRRVKLPESEVA